MAVIWITHDMGVVAGLADKVQVMYAGRVLERGPVRAIFKDPRNAYTWGLLQSLPSRPAPRSAVCIRSRASRPICTAAQRRSVRAAQPVRDQALLRGDAAAAPARRGEPGHLVAAWYDLRRRSAARRAGRARHERRRPLDASRT